MEAAQAELEVPMVQRDGGAGGAGLVSNAASAGVGLGAEGSPQIMAGAVSSLMKVGQ